MIDETGAPVLVFEAPTADGEGTTMYVIKGENLFNFYAMVKRAMEGDSKRPPYLT